MNLARRLGAIGVLACALGCGSPGQDAAGPGGPVDIPIPARTGSVLVEACQLDPWQTAQLASSSAQAVLRTVILLCPTARDDGTMAPVEPSARQELATQVSQLRAMGYEARLGVTMADELSQFYPASVLQASLASPTWRASFVAAAASFASMADGLDLLLPPPPDASNANVTALVTALSSAVGPSSLGMFVPPGGASNDVPGSAAFDFASIGPLVARVHLLTLDYSCCGSPPGPTIDPAWAVAVERAARSVTGAPLDVAYPLYGWDFGPGGQERSVGTLEALGVAADTGSTPQAGPTGEWFYDWQDGAGGAHETWFDDATSTSLALASWDTQTMPADVGVVFWGFGREDPALWDTLARETR